MSFVDYDNESIRNINAGVKKCAFPNEASLLKLAGSILIDISEESIAGNRYLSINSDIISLTTVAADFTAI